MAHKGKKVQFEIVAILGLLALFTHMHIFWVAGLMLAFIDIPDFGGFLGRIAGSVEKMAGLKPGAGAEGVPDDPAIAAFREEAAGALTTRRDLHGKKTVTRCRRPQGA